MASEANYSPAIKANSQSPRGLKTQQPLLIDLTSDSDNEKSDFPNQRKRSASVLEESEKKEARRSGRARKSTVIHVGGHTIKKENNYEMKGLTYVYGGRQDEGLKSRAASTKQSHSNQPRKPRVIGQQEKDRMDFKDKINRSIASKQCARQQFLKENLQTMIPFLEPKVINQIWNSRPSGSRVFDCKLSMQPDSITADLRDYQLEGLNWMTNMYRKNVGMILGDEMGLGKTLQTISLVCHLKEAFDSSGPSLIICPLSVLYSWCNEIENWAPSLKFLRFHSSNPESLEVEDVSKFDMIITTYEMAKASSLRFFWGRQYFNLVVLDEGHKIKSAETQIAQAVRKIHCENRLILTGTPLANNLVELWSLLNFLVPDVFTTDQPFAEAFNLTLNQVDRSKLDKAHDLLQIFMIRRLKTEVERLMPKKIETKVICPLSNTQIWWYKAILIKDIGILTGNQKPKNKLANIIMQLRKACVHPFLFNGAEDIEATTLGELVGASGKLAVLDKLLCSLYKKNHRVVLFSQFTSVLDILDDYANMRGWNYCRFDGGTSRAKRNYIVNSFNAPGSQKFLFLMSTRSGGMGLNLQTADTCVLFDSDWNPQPDIQAMARVHRIGQTKTVHVYRLVTEGTVEQRMVERAEKKLYLDRMVTRDGENKEVHNEENDETQDADKLLATLKFGCQAVFGTGTNKNQLPTDEDIEIITDRNRTEDFSAGNLKGGVDASADDFDATKKFLETTKFSGIDFTQIRKEHADKSRPKTMGDVLDSWKKRQRKNRIKMVDGMGSGYGSSAVPVLAANDYDLQSGEQSVFQKELKGRHQQTLGKKKTVQQFENQDFCQVCGDGGFLICCNRCPVSVHVRCAGLNHPKEFMHCSHHHCSLCGKNTAAAGGFLFPCQSCANAYCEDHLPSDARLLEQCPRMNVLNFHLKHGVYVHCSKQCEAVAITEYGWQVPEKLPKPPCPPALDVSSKFGGEVDDSLEAPEDVAIGDRRSRHKDIKHEAAMKAITLDDSSTAATSTGSLFEPSGSTSSDAPTPEIECKPIEFTSNAIESAMNGGPTTNPLA